LLPQELPFVSVAHLLAWQTHDEELFSDTTIRSLVRMHGQFIRQAEQAEVIACRQRDDLASLQLNLVSHEQTTPSGVANRVERSRRRCLGT
jgi:hypothetical protein